MLSSGLDENWQPTPPCRSWLKLKPGTERDRAACLGGRDGRLGGRTALTCSASVATRHVEAILRMGGVGVGIPRDLDTSARCLVGLSEMEAALKGALVL